MNAIKKNVMLYSLLFWVGAGLAIDQDQYEAWKADINESWNPVNLESSLLYYARAFLSGEHNHGALNYYNYLRELRRLPMADSITDVDEKWLTKYFFQTKQIHLSDDEIDLYQRLEEALRLLTKVMNEIEDEGESTQKVLNDYNLLRKYLALPSVASTDDVNLTWLDGVERELKTLKLRYEYGYSAPNNLQEQMIRQAAKRIGLAKIAAWGAIPEGNNIGGMSMIQGSQGMVALSETGSLETQVHTIYHELGHLVHDDPRNIAAVWNNRVDPEVLMDETDFKSDIEAVQTYLANGIKNCSLIDTTAEGRLLRWVVDHLHAQDIFERNKSLWQPPKDPQEFKKMVYLRGTEKRADLFALTCLFELGNISTIFTKLKETAAGSWQNEPIALPIRTHDSNAETALTILGFLLSKEIDVRHKFADWNKKETSPNIQSEYLTLFDPEVRLTKGEADVRAAHREWQKKK